MTVERRDYQTTEWLDMHAEHPVAREQTLEMPKGRDNPTGEQNKHPSKRPNQSWQLLQSPARERHHSYQTKRVTIHAKANKHRGHSLLSMVFTS